MKFYKLTCATLPANAPKLSSSRFCSGLLPLSSKS